MLGAVFADILESEASGKIEIELDSGELPGTADGVNEFYVDFGAVKSAFADNPFVGNVHALHGFGKAFAGTAPVFGLALVIFGMGGVPVGEFDFELVEAEIFHDGQGELEAGFHFALDLRRHAEDVGVVLGEAADAEQAVENAAAFIAIDGAEFGEANGKLAITVQL